MEPLKLNTKFVYDALVAHAYGKLDARNGLIIAHKLGLISGISLDIFKKTLHDESMANSYKFFNEQKELLEKAPGELLTLEKMLERVSVKVEVREFVECLYVCNGNLEEAKDICLMDKKPKNYSAPLNRERVNNRDGSEIPRKDSLYGPR